MEDTCPFTETIEKVTIRGVGGRKKYGSKDEDTRARYECIVDDFRKNIDKEIFKPEYLDVMPVARTKRILKVKTNGSFASGAIIPIHVKAVGEVYKALKQAAQSAHDRKKVTIDSIDIAPYLKETNEDIILFNALLTADIKDRAGKLTRKRKRTRSRSRSRSASRSRSSSKSTKHTKKPVKKRAKTSSC